MASFRIHVQPLSRVKQNSCLGLVACHQLLGWSKGKTLQSWLCSVETAVGIQKCSMKLTQSRICLDYQNLQDVPFVKIAVIFVMTTTGQDLGMTALTLEHIEALLVREKDWHKPGGLHLGQSRKWWAASFQGKTSLLEAEFHHCDKSCKLRERRGCNNLIH